MKAKQAKIFAICMIAICLIIAVLYFARISVNAAATAGKITFAVLATSTAPSTMCGDGVCEAGEDCAVDCINSQVEQSTDTTTTTQGKVFQIKFTSFMLILLIMVLCALAYIYLKEDKRTANGYWQYGFQRS